MPRSLKILSLLCLLLLLVSFSFAAPISKTSGDCGNASPCNPTFTAATGGSAVYILGFVTSNSASPTTITGCSGTWQTAFSFPLFDGHREAFLLYLLNVGAGCTTAQLTFPASTGAAWIELEEGGVATSSAIDAVPGSFTVGNGTCTSASLTPTSGQNELFIGLYYEGTNASQTWAGTNGWTMEQPQGNTTDGDTVAAADQSVASTTGSYALSGTVTPGTNSRCAFATFKNAAVGGSGGAMMLGTATVKGTAVIK